jgi:hypothetical protein
MTRQEREKLALTRLRYTAVLSVVVVILAGIHSKQEKNDP